MASRKAAGLKPRSDWRREMSMEISGGLTTPLRHRGVRQWGYINDELMNG